jgi:hypothetical protein
LRKGEKGEKGRKEEPGRTDDLVSDDLRVVNLAPTSGSGVTVERERNEVRKEILTGKRETRRTGQKRRYPTKREKGMVSIESSRRALEEGQKTNTVLNPEWKVRKKVSDVRRKSRANVMRRTWLQSGSGDGVNTARGRGMRRKRRTVDIVLSERLGLKLLPFELALDRVLSERLPSLELVVGLVGHNVVLCCCVCVVWERSKV